MLCVLVFAYSDQFVVCVVAACVLHVMPSDNIASGGKRLVISSGYGLDNTSSCHGDNYQNSQVQNLLFHS